MGKRMLLPFERLIQRIQWRLILHDALTPAAGYTQRGCLNPT